MSRELLVAVLLPLLAAGCSKKTGIVGASCNASADCQADLQCIQNICLEVAATTPLHDREVRALRTEIHTLRQHLLAGKDSSPQLSSLECQAYAKQVVELTVQAQEDGALADMVRSMLEAQAPDLENECLSKGTRAQVACALRALTIEGLELCSSGDHPAKERPTAHSCRAFADKIVELTVQGLSGEPAELARATISEMRPEMIQECTEKGSKGEVRCALRAKSLDDLERCGGTRTR